MGIKMEQNDQDALPTCDWKQVPPWLANFDGEAVRCGTAAIYRLARDNDCTLNVCTDHLGWFLYVHGQQVVSLNLEVEGRRKARTAKKNPVR